MSEIFAAQKSRKMREFGDQPLPKLVLPVCSFEDLAIFLDLICFITPLRSKVMIV